MIEQTLARRYAAAILSLSERERSVDATGDQIAAVAEAYRTSADLRLLLHHPSVPRREKKSILQKTFGTKVSRMVMEFLDLLVEKGRIAFLPAIAEVFEKLAVEHKGVVRVDVKSYLPLKEREQTILAQKLESLLKKKVLLAAKQDLSLKGGIVIRFGDTVIDASVAERLKDLRDSLLGIHNY